MSGKNIHTIEANKDIDPTTAFESTFAPLAIDEVLLEFDAHHPGPPMFVLSNDAGAKKEIHPQPQRGRDGHFVAHTEGSGTWSKIRVALAPRGTKAKLLRIKLIAKGAT